MAPQASAHRVKKPKAKWSMTVMMNARDLSRDDDFLSHLLVEHLGTDDSPLQVHKMDPSRRLPKHDPSEVLAIVRKYVVRRGGSSTSASRVKRAVDALLELSAVKQYLHKRSTSQINAFATHASRYFELYLPTGSIEISHTSRYSHRTGKSELCILATTPLKVGQVISDLKGSLAHLTVEEDEELKKTDSRRRDGGIRRDFSVIHSNQKNKSHLFLGPARFVNHDCDHNVELFRDGRVITFRVIKPIAAGQEVTAHYGEGYFGKGNRHCLCQTCERLGRGGYTPEEPDSDHELEDDSSTDEETREERIKAGLGLTAKGNPNERRTRRGVYAILPEEDTDDEERVGATEAVAARVPVQLVEPAAKKEPASAGSGSIQSSNLIPLSSALSVLSPSVSTENVSLKAHDRRTSTASSELTSLPDSDKAAAHSEGSTSSRPNPPPAVASESSLSSLSSAGTPAQPGTAAPASTPPTSRMSTRSSTASQSKGKGKEENSLSGMNPGAKEAQPTPDKRSSLRSSRSTAALPEKPKAKELDSLQSRQTRHSLPSGLEAPPLDGVRSSSNIVAKTALGKSQSKSATPAAAAAPGGGSPAVKKTQPDVPSCATCFVEMPHLIGVKRPKTAVNACPRCKRHLAIFGSTWPNRNPSFEAPTSSSSESSSVEIAFEIIRQKLKDIPTHGNKFKYGRKYVEIKHPAFERPVKRRKTDSAVLYATKSALNHSEEQSRSVSGHTDSNGKPRKHGVHVEKTFNITGGVQRSRAHRALSRERVKNGGPAAETKRRWGDSFPDPDQAALDRIRAIKRDDHPSNIPKAFLPISGFRKTIRRFPPMPSLPVAKPLAALCVRPTPNMFARNSWAMSNFGDGEGEGDVGDGDSVMDTSSDLTDLPEPEPKPAPQVGQKRKRDPLPSDSKPKKGKSFYMKEKKPMPKGWVLVTSSSEETEEDEGDEDVVRKQDDALKGDPPRPGVPGNPKGQISEAAFYSATGADSASGSTPSLAHTPSSRAASTPTQSSGTLVEEQASAASTAGKRAVITYSLRKSAASRTPSTVQSLKRKRVDTEVNASPSRGKAQGLYVNKYTDIHPTLEAPQHLDANDRQLDANDQDVVTPPNDTPDSASPNDGSEVFELSMEDSSSLEIAAGPIAMLQASFSPKAGITAKAGQLPVLIGESISPPVMTFGKQPTRAVVELPDPETKRAALEISNIIHGTAFSYGHPDARTTWKPIYHFSELDGWDSEVETCL